MDGNWSVPGYRHVRTLGSGASGTVVLAVHEATGTSVAVKYLSDELRTDARFLDRFRSEARLMAELTDPHIVRLYEYVESPAGAAFVMELVDGVTLKDILGAEGATGPEAALAVLKGSLLGLASAHTAGVVHRDYKPANVLVRDDGTTKLADFGIAVRADQRATASGTPAYMAPEQWTTGSVGPSTDVYAATAVWYECLTGELPYPVEGMWALAAAHRLDPIPSDRVPPPLRGLIERGLAKDFADRPASAEEFLAELEAAALAGYGPGWEERGRVRLAALAALLASMFPLADPIDTGGTALALTRLGRSRLLVLSAVTAGALLAGGGGAVLLSAGLDRQTVVEAAATSSPAPSAEPSIPAAPTPTPSPDTGDPTPPVTPETTAPADVTSAPTTGAPASGTPAPSATSSVTVAPTPTPHKPPPTTVTGLNVDSVKGPGPGKGTYPVTVTVTVTISGPAPVTVEVTVRGGEESGSAGSQTAKGAGDHTLTFSYSFTQCPSTVQATASAGGKSANGSGPIDCRTVQ